MARIKSRKFSIYTPGMGLLVNFTAAFTQGVTGSTQLIGLGDELDGLFFGYNGATFGVLRRQNGTDYWTPQMEWNGDKLDGNGESQVSLNTTLGNIYAIEFQWLGYGLIRFFVVNQYTGKMITVHTIEYPNTSVEPHIMSPNLPLMAEVRNTSNQSNVKVETPCAIVHLEGNLNSALSTTNAMFSNKTIAANVPTNMLTIRNKTLISGKTNRVTIELTLISNSSEGNKPVRIRLIRNGTINSASYNDIHQTNSVIEYDTTGTYVADTGKFLLGNTLAKADAFTLPLHDIDIFLEPGHSISVVAISSQTSEVSVQLSWKEYY